MRQSYTMLTCLNDLFASGLNQTRKLIDKPKNLFYLPLCRLGWRIANELLIIVIFLYITTLYRFLEFYKRNR